MLALGSNPTLYGGEIELSPFEWLIPIQKGLPALKAEYEMVRTSTSGSAEGKTAAIAGIKTKWLGRLDEVRTAIAQFGAKIVLPDTAQWQV